MKTDGSEIKQAQRKKIGSAKNFLKKEIATSKITNKCMIVQNLIKTGCFVLSEQAAREACKAIDSFINNQLGM